MATVVINAVLCKGCGLCVQECKRDSLSISEHMNAAGYFVAEQSNPEKCVGCTLCGIICPDCAITVYK